MTPQDIREKAFEKAVFGGYDMGGVDDFLEEIAAELETAQKESHVLKSKMKVLVDKIEEYRTSENAMSQTLMAAQKFAAQLEGEARARAEKTISDANASAARTLSEADGRAAQALAQLRAETEQEQARLAAAKAATARFLEEARTLCARQLEYLGRIPDIAKAAPKNEAAIDDAVKSIEDSVARIPVEPAPRMEIPIEPVPFAAAPRDDATRMFGSSSAD